MDVSKMETLNGYILEDTDIQPSLHYKLQSITNSNQPPAPKKFLALGSAAPYLGRKAGEGKAGKAKDSKQGNISLFF
ncbi:hypothetical protein SLE2022_318020 [Rubroshorea leprosula]